MQSVMSRIPPGPRDAAEQGLRQRRCERAAARRIAEENVRRSSGDEQVALQEIWKLQAHAMEENFCDEARTKIALARKHAPDAIDDLRAELTGRDDQDPEIDPEVIEKFRAGKARAFEKFLSESSAAAGELEPSREGEY
jgi:hypothetical protein